MKIIVKRLNAPKSATLDVTGSHTILQVKKLIEEQFQIPFNFQSLVFAGKPLSDKSTLDSVGVKENSKLHVISRQPEKNGEHSAQQTPQSDDLHSILTKILRKHLTADQTARVIAEFSARTKNMTDNMNLEDIRRFVESDFKEF